MSLPSPETPLYNHPLPTIEQWLSEHGCRQDDDDRHCWHLEHPNWSAELCLDVEELSVVYFNTGEGRDIRRSFKYSLSRQDIEDAVFSGP
ncbi:DUF3143 domain-containing protein [Leptolyngbya sp. FACHB-261]|uniref:DUF3143 domain-containing protein n=1 Tax=Leptolyngbya sp. FACHB-261 TaxID=2692806 RepID=UPI001682B176|nr:DUF3143 domain-containing protein [Leptolyngbya sp. FACHB-261]MBD2105033.1 DUF3143 domain-containing protein [Leptolyngbya sp. FACHB-261]